VRILKISTFPPMKGMDIIRRVAISKNLRIAPH
jgi:hypothetical protein